MSALRTRRHSSTAREHPVLRWVSALLVGAALFVPIYNYFIIAGAAAGIEAHDVVLLLGPDRPAPPPPPTDEAQGQWVNILVMGSDTRVGANANIGGDNGGDTSMRNDTTMILHVSADRSRVEIVSIPRDSRVRIPDCELSDGTQVPGWTGKFNIAFSNGGREGEVGDAAACTIRAVEALTGIRIDEYVVVDFYGVQSIIDILGGVPMCIPFDIVSPKAQLTLEAGPQILNGAEAIGWARARTLEFPDKATRRAFEAIYGGNGDDRSRIARQQQLIGSVFEVAIAQNLMMHPAQLTSVLQAAAGSMTVSPNFKEVDYLVGLAWSIRHIDKANIVFVTVPTKMNANGSDVDWLPASATLFQNIVDDVPIEGKSVAEMSTAAPVPSPTATGGTATGTAVEGDIDLLASCVTGG